MINLLTNAISYSPKSSEVIITIKEVDDGQIISVKDNGIGISKDEQNEFLKDFIVLIKRVVEIQEEQDLVYPLLNIL